METLRVDPDSLTRASTARARSPQRGMFARIFDSMGEIYCGLQGHDMLMRFEQNRVFLECASCGHKSPGWTITKTQPKSALRGDARRHVLTRPQLVPTRRVA
jgi:hypothetical protein